MALLTLNNSLADMGGSPVTMVLQIELDGLVVGGYGKLLWAGADLQIEPRARGCVLRMTAATGGQSSFYVDAEDLGGRNGVRPFVAWLEQGASRAGASVAVLRPAA